MNFFIATLGRSGTNWLHQILNKSSIYTVGHEECDGRDPRFVHCYSPFPIERFARPFYGEVHGFLRYHLSKDFEGPEVMIERKALLERCPFEVIRSWIQCGKREDWEFSAVVFEVLTQQRLLREWAEKQPMVRRLDFKKLTTDLQELQDLCDWLEIGYTPTEEDLKTKKGESNGTFIWTQGLVDKVNVIGERQGLKELKYDFTRAIY